MLHSVSVCISVPSQVFAGAKPGLLRERRVGVGLISSGFRRTNRFYGIKSFWLVSCDVINGFPRLLSVVDKGKYAFQPLLPFSSWLTSASLRLKRRKLLEYPSATGADSFSEAKIYLGDKEHAGNAGRISRIFSLELIFASPEVFWSLSKAEIAVEEAEKATGLVPGHAENKIESCLRPENNKVPLFIKGTRWQK